MMTLNVRRILVILVIVLISTTACDARPKKSESYSEKPLAARIKRGGHTFLEPLPFIGTSTGLSLGNKLQRNGFGILVGPMLRIVNFLYKIHRWFK